MPWKSAPCREALEAVRPPPDRLERDRPQAEHDERERERVAARHEHEERGEPERQHGGRDRDPVRADVVLERPERQQHERVRDRGRREEAVERDEKHDEGGCGSSHRSEHPWALGAPLDPREEPDDEQWRDVEEVALLDPIRERGRESGDHRNLRDRDRHRRREVGLERWVERPRPSHEHDRRGERNDEDVQRELGDVPHEVVEDLTKRVARVADGLVGAEDVVETSGR